MRPRSLSSTVLCAAMLASCGGGDVVREPASSASATGVSALFDLGATAATEHAVPGLAVVVREWPIAPRVRQIVANPRAREKIRVAFPNHAPIEFSMTRFEARSGFDGNGEPDPGVADAGLSYAWQGASEGREMAIDVTDGRMSATIQAGGARLYIVSFQDGLPVLREIDQRRNVPEAGER